LKDIFIIFEPTFNCLPSCKSTQKLSMHISVSKGIFCHKGFTRQFFSRMCRSWMCFLFSGLMSNSYKNINITNSITYPPTITPGRTPELSVRGGEVHSVFVGCKGYFLPGGTYLLSRLKRL
jgi:hypothetical protein